jgi:predicted RNA-binding Zn ribbon-like protein
MVCKPCIIRHTPVPSYPSHDLPLPLELLNTSFLRAGQPVDALATPDDLDAWLQANAAHFVIAPGRATPTLLRKFRRLRTALHQLVSPLVDGGPLPAPSSAAVKRINALSARSRVFRWLEVRDGTYHQRIADASEDAPLAAVARASIELLAGADVERIGRCQAPNCVLFFLKEGRRREWCSDTCGNRARVARHYLRHRSETPASAEDGVKSSR